MAHPYLHSSPKHYLLRRLSGRHPALSGAVEWGEEVKTSGEKSWRWWRHFWQRRYRGFDDSVTWNLDVEMARWLLPRLRRFREITICHPVTLTEKQWDKYLDEMMFALEKAAF